MLLSNKFSNRPFRSKSCPALHLGFKPLATKLKTCLKNMARLESVCILSSTHHSLQVSCAAGSAPKASLNAIFLPIRNSISTPLFQS
jgi:hypothetical protein